MSIRGVSNTHLMRCMKQVQEKGGGVPFTKRLYHVKGGYFNAKAALDAVRNNWRSGNKIQRRLSSEEKDQWMKNISWLGSYVNNLKQLHRKKGGGSLASYQARKFTKPHNAWKNVMNYTWMNYTLKLTLKLREEEMKILYLDALNETGKSLRTTTMLKQFFPSEMLYCANPDRRIFQRLRREGVNASCLLFKDAVEREWMHEKFDSLFLDLCTSCPRNIVQNIKTVLPCLLPGAVIALTITPRYNKGVSMEDRIANIKKYLKKMGFMYLDESGICGVKTCFFQRRSV